MFRVAVVGAGQIGRRHVEVLARSNSAECCAIVDPVGETYAAEQGVPWFATLPELLAADKPDGLIIATPNDHHVKAGLQAVSAGIPALIEKPIAESAARAEVLVDAAEAADVPLLIGHHRLHNPIIAAAKAQLDAGRIGRIVAVHGMFWIYKPEGYFDADWRRNPGAGPIFINLIHDIYLLRHLVGEIVSVQALQSNAVRGFDVEDTAAVLLQFENGAVGTVTISDTIVSPWSWELSAAENPDYPPMGQNSYQIGGTEGALEIPRGRVWAQEKLGWFDPMSVADYPVEMSDPLDVQLAHFCDVIAGRALPLVTGREAVKSLRVVEAVKQAAETGARLDVPQGPNRGGE